jgi:hypothetical protein
MMVTPAGAPRQVCVDAGSALHAPDSLSDHEAAGLMEATLTAYLNIFEVGHAQPGQLVLIHGGGSGVGTQARRPSRMRPDLACGRCTCVWCHCLGHRTPITPARGRLTTANLAAGAVAVQGQGREDARDGGQVGARQRCSSWTPCEWCDRLASHAEFSTAADLCFRWAVILSLLVACVMRREDRPGITGLCGGRARPATSHMCPAEPSMHAHALLSRARASQRREGAAMPQPRGGMGVQLQDRGLGGECQVVGQAAGSAHHSGLRRVRSQLLLLARLLAISLHTGSHTACVPERCCGCSRFRMPNPAACSAHDGTCGAGRHTWRGISTASRLMGPSS